MEFPAGQGWGQSNRIRIVMAGGFQNLNGFSGIRLQLQAGQSRTVRINLETDPYAWGGQYGWDVQVSSTPMTATLLFDDASTGDTWSPTTIEDALASIWALGISPGVGSGFLQIDDIEFLP